MAAKKNTGFSRRQFLKGGSAGGVLVLGSAAGVITLSRRGIAFPSGAPNTSYTQHQQDTIEALGDTVIPGAYWPDTAARASRFASELGWPSFPQEPQDPNGAGGAVQSGVWSSFFDPAYGLNPYFPTIVSDLDSCTNGGGTCTNYGLNFKYLTRAQRMAVLDRQFTSGGSMGMYAAAYQGAVTLAKYNFLGGLVNSVGTSYVGFPGPNSGNSVWDSYYGRYVVYASGYTPAALQLAANPTDCPFAIPDNNATGITSNIAVSPPSAMASRSITNLQVTVEIDHTWIGDLCVTLFGPNGFSAVIYNQTGGSAHNLYATYAVPGAVGRLAGGTWSLHVQDLAAQDVGTLQTWSLLFTF